jgi:DNA-binding transcriptional regulator PaaX
MTTFEAAMILDGCWDLTDIEPSEEAFIEACQNLINSGAAWQLQGSVGRACARMIDAGLCTVPA